jgi:hypothetical protein
MAPWKFSTSENAGVHLSWRLISGSGVTFGAGLAGMFERVVPPGESIDLDIPLPALPAGERFTLRVDMIDPQHASFLQAGGEMLEGEFQVGNPAS